MKELASPAEGREGEGVSIVNIPQAAPSERKVWEFLKLKDSCQVVSPSLAGALCEEQLTMLQFLQNLSHNVQ